MTCVFDTTSLHSQVEQPPVAEKLLVWKEDGLALQRFSDVLGIGAGLWDLVAQW